MAPLASMMMMASPPAARMARVRASLSSSWISAFLRSVIYITERKNAEIQLLESEARTRAILAAGGDAIIIIDAKGAIESLNPAAEKLFGYTADELIGRNVKMLMPMPYQREHDG